MNVKDEILQKMSAVLGALNSVTVSGKKNLSNLGGSIDLLEKLAVELVGYKIERNDTDEQID